MGRIAELLHHPSEMISHPRHIFEHHRKTGIGGIVVLALLVLGLAWMWPEIQRYARMRRM